MKEGFSNISEVMTVQKEMGKGFNFYRSIKDLDSL